MSFRCGLIHFTMWELAMVIKKVFMKIKTIIFSCFVSLTTFFSVEAADQIKTNSTADLLNEIQTNLLKSFALGQPTNDISLGIKSVNSSQSNIFVCLFYVGQTNSRQFWIAPPRFQRVEYYLYDSSGKVVPYQATYHPANKIYKTISDVPKNVHGVREGLMAPPFSMPYEQSTLTDIFQIEHGGDYRLVAKGRAMKINDDGSLSIIEFPPVSLPIHLRDEDMPTKSN